MALAFSGLPNPGTRDELRRDLPASPMKPSAAWTDASVASVGQVQRGGKAPAVRADRSLTETARPLRPQRSPKKPSTNRMMTTAPTSQTIRFMMNFFSGAS